MHRHPAKLQAWNPSLEKVDQTHPGVGPSQFQPLQAWMRSNQHGTFTHGAPIMCPCMWHAWVDQPHMLVICCVGMHCTLADTTPSCMHGRAVHTCTTTTMCNPSMPHAIMATHLMPEAPCMQTNAPPTSHIATLSVCSSPTLVGGCMHALECINMVQHSATYLHMCLAMHKWSWDTSTSMHPCSPHSHSHAHQVGSPDSTFQVAIQVVSNRNVCSMLHTPKH